MIDDDDKWWHFGQKPASAETPEERCERIVRETKDLLERACREEAAAAHAARRASPEAWREAKLTEAELADLMARLDRNAKL